LDQGAWLVAISAAVALGTALLLRRKLPSAAVAFLLGLAGAGMAWGAMLIQPDPSIGELVSAVAILAVLVPAHVRIVLGPFGPRH
jgi:hypothetical protein